MKAIRSDEFKKLNDGIKKTLPDVSKLEVIETQHQQSPADTLKAVREALTLYELAYYQLRNFATQCGEFSIGEEDIILFNNLMDSITTAYPSILTLYTKIQSKYVENKGFMSLCEKSGWNLIDIICGECGSPMAVTEGLGNLSVYYKCEKEGCNNRMNPQLFERIYSKIIDAMAKNPDTDLTGLKWENKTSYQYHTFEVSKFSPNKVTVKVRNVYRNGM